MAEEPKQDKETDYDSDSYASKYLPDKSIYTDDSRIFHRYGYEYDYVASVEKAEYKKGILSLDILLFSKKNAKLEIYALNENTVRMKMWQGEAQFKEKSDMLVIPASKVYEGKFTEKSNFFKLEIGAYILHIMKEPFTIMIFDNKSRLITQLETEQIADDYVTPPLGFRKSGKEAWPFFSWRIKNEEKFFGLGEKWNKVEKSSTRATIWSFDTCGSNTNDLSYKSVPVLFSTEGWGVMMHSSFRSYWEIGTFSYTSGSCMTEDNKLDLFLFLAPTLKELLMKYTDITGKPQMPPKWAFGIWMSRCAYQTRAQIEEVLERLRKEKIPCDVIHIDPLWMKTHYYFKIGVDACDFSWNEEGFPDHKEMFKEFMDMGFNTCLWINPYLPEGTPIYDEAKEKGYLLKSTEGGIARLSHGQPVGMIDFTNPDAKGWWKGHLKQLLQEGASVLKPDYGDRVPENALAHDGRTGKELHNIYLHYYGETAFEASKEIRGEGMVWRRAGYIGTQRYPGTWAGDTQVTWQGLKCSLRGGLSAGMTGEPFWAHDIGGFTGPEPSEELYIRWAQVGLLCPLARFHGTTPREPWFYGDKALEIVRNYANLRYRLIPYFLSQAEKSVTTGLPMMRHMQLEFPDEPNMDTLDNQFTLGEDILIAPVTDDGVRERFVYFPQGKWWSIYDETKSIDGAGFVKINAPLERIPVFIREGAIIPQYIHKPQHLKGEPAKEIKLDLYFGMRENTLKFKEGDYLVEIDYSLSSDNGTISINAVPIKFKIHFAGIRIKNISPGQEEFDSKNQEISLDASQGIEIKFSVKT